MVETPRPAPTPIAAARTERPYPWLALLALVAITSATVAGWRVRRGRMLARTQAALGLAPRLDPAAGVGALGGLALAGPSVAIRARLDHG